MVNRNELKMGKEYYVIDWFGTFPMFCMVEDSPDEVLTFDSYEKAQEYGIQNLQDWTVYPDKVEVAHVQEIK